MKLVFKTMALMAVLTACSNEDQDWDATGMFEATEVTVSAEANGRLIHFDVDEGYTFKTGQEIGLIDTTQLFLNKMQLRAGMRAVDIRIPDIQKQIAVLEQRMATARTERMRMKRLVAANAGNQKSVDDWDHQLDLLERELTAQRSTLRKTSGSGSAEVERLRYQILQIEDQLYKSVIRAPRKGTVLRRYAAAGEMTAIGKPLFKMADLDIMYLRVYLTGLQLSKIKLNQQLTIRVDEGNGFRSMKGTVTWISDKAEFTPKGVQTKDERSEDVYAVKLTVKNDGYLKIGQYGDVSFKAEEHD